MGCIGSRVKPSDDEHLWCDRIVQRWLPDATSRLQLIDKEAALADAAAACVTAGEAAPCKGCGGCFAERWGDNEPWHCFDCKRPLDTVRSAPEAAAKSAAEAIDAPFLMPSSTESPVLSSEGMQRLARRGIRVGFLLHLLESLPVSAKHTLTTGQVAAKIVKPATAHHRCPFVELPAVRAHDVGPPRAFVSHTWGAPFADLVAAIMHMFKPSDFVWIDVFAVRQWPGNMGDLNFECVIRAAALFVLVAVDLPELTALSEEDLIQRRLPDSAMQRCAYYRVWCLVELSEALLAHKTVVMLTGHCGTDGSFEPQVEGLGYLATGLDVRQARATVPADRERILEHIRTGVGFDELNRLAKGAMVGSPSCMKQPALLAAVCGDLAPLAALSGGAQLNEALSGAAGGGFLAPTQALLARAQEFNLDAQSDDGGFTALMRSCFGGQEECARALLNAGANAEIKAFGSSSHLTDHREAAGGRTALIWACHAGQTGCVRVLLEAKADLDAQEDAGSTGLLWACHYGHYECARTLVEGGAQLDVQNEFGDTALMRACRNGCASCARLLLQSGAQADLQIPATGFTSLMEVCYDGQAAIAEALLEASASVDMQEKSNGMTALFMACLAGRESCARLLLDAGACVNLRTSSGDTPLMIARTQGHLAIVEMFGTYRIETP